MVRLFNNEQGNIAAPLLVLVGGVSLFFAQNEMKSLNTRVDQVREENRKNFVGQQNVSALQLTARLLVGDGTQAAAPIRLDPYIPGGLCEQGRELTAASGLNWQSSGQTVTVHGVTQNLLQKSGETIFTQLSQGKAPSITADVSTRLKVLGWKCSSTHPFLMEGVYVEAEGTSPNAATGAAGLMKTKALLTMSPPPPSTCLFYAKDPAGQIYPGNKQPTGHPELSIAGAKADLYLECNHVVTDAKIYKDGSKLADTNSYPLTAANRIDEAQKLLLGPIPLEASTNDLQAVIEQVDGTKVTLGMKLILAVAPPPPTETVTEGDQDCSNKCVNLPGEVYPIDCDNRLVHKDYYQDINPKYHVCYKCGYFYGFDPKDKCKSVGVVGERGEGCFAADTKILLASGEEALIQDLKAGDRIWNPLLKKAVTVARMVQGPESQALYRITQAGRMVRVTRFHPFVTPLGLMPAEQLKAGDQIQGQDGRWISIDAVAKEDQGYHANVWNLELTAEAPTEASHMVVANGILTGDLYLQERVRSRPLLEYLSQKTSIGLLP